MVTKDISTVKYSYSYLQKEDNKFFCTDTIIGKLPKIKMTLPKLNLAENLNLAFC